MEALDDDGDLFADDPDMFIAKHDLTPTGPGQLAFTEGNKIHVKQYDDARDWCEVETDSGATGWVPTAYLVKPNSLERESISGQYSLTLRYNGYTHHYRIYSDDGEDYYYISSNAKFTTLRLLVHHHSNQLDGMITTLRYPAIKPTKPPVSSLCNEVDKWEINRSDLVLGAKLGTGQYSEVYKAMIKSQGKTVAVKTFKVFC